MRKGLVKRWKFVKVKGKMKRAKIALQKSAEFNVALHVRREARRRSPHAIFCLPDWMKKGAGIASKGCASAQEEG